MQVSRLGFLGIKLKKYLKYFKQVIKEAMPVNILEKIRQFLHFNDLNMFVPNGQVRHDRLFRLHPVIDSLRARFKIIPLEEAFCR